MMCSLQGVLRILKWLSAVLILGLVLFAWLRLQVPAPESGANHIPPPVPAPVPVPDVKPEPAAHMSEIPAGSTFVELGGGRLAIGAVTLDRKSREIIIPAEVNMREGAVEYVLVGRDGKVHESVFTTTAAARDIHVAALLLGMKPEPDLGPENSGTAVRRESAAVISVEWDSNGPPVRIFLNETVNLSDPSTDTVAGNLPSGAWLYNGSRFEGDGVFAATRYASIISIIRDPDALVNHPGTSRDNDKIHTPNAAKLPKTGHPVRIILHVK
jgi:hypothetical protein